jgi:hypothetical protein
MSSALRHPEDHTPASGHLEPERRVAFLSMDSLADFVCYDALLEAPLAAKGWRVDTISWRNPNVDWDLYDAVVVRSSWDYQDDPQAFDAVLQRIEDSTAQLENPLALMRWNIHKGYLRELELKGIPIVPTRFVASGEALELEEAFARWSCPELILKPAISANADHTHRLTPEAWVSERQELERVFQNKDALIQPFMPAVVEEGEYSLFYFGDRFSHAILKTPEERDFRVQEEHGGRLQAIEPEPELREAGDAVMALLRPRPLYARIDFVRDQDLPGADGSFLLMEVELIEPSLYFNLDPESPERFAEIFDAWMRGPAVAEDSGVADAGAPQLSYPEYIADGDGQDVDALEADPDNISEADAAVEGSAPDAKDDHSLDWIWS